MIKLYTVPSSISSRKAAQWLTDHHLPFRAQKISQVPLTKAELEHILTLTNHGISDIVAVRSRLFKHLCQKPGFSLDKLSLGEFVNLALKQPSLLHWPIIINGSQLEVGYNKNEIRCFLPHSVRVSELHALEAKLS